MTTSGHCCRRQSPTAHASALRWWTWAGYRVNATLKATLGGVADSSQRVSDLFIRLRGDLRASTWPEVRDLRDHLVLPEVDDKALTGRKFSAALLPTRLAVATLAARLADLEHAATVLAEPVRFQR